MIRWANATTWLIFLIGVGALTLIIGGALVGLLTLLIVKFTRKNSQAETQSKPTAGKDEANVAASVVADTVVGLNLRTSDNSFQIIFIGISVLLLSTLGAVLALTTPAWQLPWFGGALLGAFAGLTFGVLASGAFLMVYRFIQHVRGNHD